MPGKVNKWLAGAAVKKADGVSITDRRDGTVQAGMKIDVAHPLSLDRKGGLAIPYANRLVGKLRGELLGAAHEPQALDGRHVRSDVRLASAGDIQQPEVLAGGDGLQAAVIAKGHMGVFNDF